MIEIGINTKKLEKQLKNIVEKQIPFSTSNAMRKTVIRAKQDAAKNAAATLDRPTKGLTESAVNKGWIRVVWPSKADLKRGSTRRDGSSAEARVFIIDPLVDTIHPLVYGGVQRKVPARSDAVVQPTRALIKGLQGVGRLKQLNKYGNIAGFHRGILSRLKANDKLYLNVPIGSSNPKTRHLAPGLYFKGREITREAGSGRKVVTKLTHSRVQLSPEQRRRGLRVRSQLTMLLSYEKARTMKAGKWKFNEVVVASFKKNYGQHFRTELANAIATSK